VTLEGGGSARLNALSTEKTGGNAGEGPPRGRSFRGGAGAKSAATGPATAAPPWSTRQRGKQ
jgi:hypothetical protein